ncbi:PRADC1-like protein [Schistocerca cancellata]|uniref:PRADC1-like protein n=1 Tax=Schistocerca cancellata TaxID=274614 RepID=UPI002117D68F|nr:PRADC1-like protein [Schistocerca cancellata]
MMLRNIISQHSVLFFALTVLWPGCLPSVDFFVESTGPLLENLDNFDFDIFFEVIEPEELAYTYKIRPAKDFGIPLNQSFAGQGVDLVLVYPATGCGWPSNAEEIEGNVALVERGECSFLSKTIKAEEAGATAVIIADYDEENDGVFIEMIDDKTHREAHIPAAFLLGKNGHVIRRTLERLNRNYAVINIPVNLTFIPLHETNQPPWIRW